MKKLLFTLAIALMFVSCMEREDIKTYGGPSLIHFENVNSFDTITRTFLGLRSSEGESQDTYVISFAYTPNQSDSLIKIPIVVSDRPEDFSRSYKVEVVDSATTAQEGVDYEFYKNDYEIPAGKLRDSVQVRVYNNSLKTDSVRLK